MSELILPTRRGFLAGMIGLIAAPAIVRASSLMPVKALAATVNIEPELQQFVVTNVSGNKLLTLDAITREAVRQWKESRDAAAVIVESAGDIRIGDVITISGVYK
jgi:hypothetical protein